MKKGLLYLLTFVLVASFTACEKDEEATPDYVGKWTTTEVDEEDGTESIIVLTLAESSFEMIQSVKVGSVSIEAMGMKGSMTVTGEKLVITPTSIGSAVDFETGEVGEMDWFDKGSDEFEMMIAFMGGATMEATYSVAGDKLTLSFENDDPQVFTKM